MGIPRHPCHPVEECQCDLPIGSLLLEDLEDNILVYPMRKLTKSVANISITTTGLENSQDFTGIDIPRTLWSVSNGMAKS
jgi:hypothetical protein